MHYRVSLKNHIFTKVKGNTKHDDANYNCRHDAGLKQLRSGFRKWYSHERADA
jgi:hypothetical protein